MGCCNEKRARWRQTSAAVAGTMPSRSVNPPAREVPLTHTSTFEYVGETAMSVVGPVTRTYYRFGATGARVGVDRRDVPYLSGVPNLRRVRETPVES
jgi:hypothetical protein